MAESKINAPMMNAIRKGQTVSFNTIVSGYVTGSGNYVTFDIPCQYADDVTGASNTALNSVTIWLGGGAMKQKTDIDTSYDEVALSNNRKAIRVTLKFASTQAINIPCTIYTIITIAFS